MKKTQEWVAAAVSAHAGTEVQAAHQMDGPPLFFYGIEENKLNIHDPLLTEAGGDRITWHLFLIYSGWSSCFGVHSLNDVTRYHLIAAMLGLPVNELPWKLQDQTTIYWENNPKYLLDLQNVIRSQQAKLHQTVEALREKGLLTKRESATTLPKLLITISDHRKPPIPPLPKPPIPVNGRLLDH